MFRWIVHEPQWRRILLRDPCVYCGAPATGLDHIHPRKFGGTDAWRNRAPACATCDGEKDAELLLSYLLRRSQPDALPLRTRDQGRRFHPELPAPPPLYFTLGEILHGTSLLPLSTLSGDAATVNDANFPRASRRAGG